MWDWSGSKMPPPSRGRDEAVQQAQNQGVTPMRRDARSVPIYRDPRSFRSLPPTAPASGYPDPLDMSQQTPYYPNAPMPAQNMPAQPAYPPPYPPQPQGWGSAPPSYPYAPPPPQQPMGYPMPQAPQVWGQGYPPQQPLPQQGWAGQPQQQMSYPMPTPVPAAYPMPTHQQGYQAPSLPSMPNQALGDKSMWEWQMTQMDLPKMDLLEVNYIMLDTRWKLELRKAFKRARRDFLKYVGYHHINELLSAGIDEEGIRMVKRGKAPENFNVHIKIPFDYGGTNDFSNLVLIQTHPFHVNIHKLIDMQTVGQRLGAKPTRLFIPAPKGKVYFPIEVEISSGGTSKHDRSVYAGFLESTFEVISQKTMRGR